jgi:hypothetical protein
MSRASASFLLLITLGFIASSLGFSLHMAAAPTSDLADMLAAPRFFDPEPPARVDLSAMFLHPDSIGMRALLLTAWAALAYHALRCLIWPAREGATTGQAPLIAALAVGAIWPWIATAHPLLGLLLAAVMLAGLLAAALQPLQQGDEVGRSSALGFAAGWGMLVCLSGLAALLQEQLGLPQAAAAVIAILIGAIAAVSVQLRLGPRIGFSVALIWGLIGIAAGTVTTDAAIATATVLAIAIIAVALVRVTT